MALPTRVIRALATHPFNVAQRDFDVLMDRLFNGGQQSTEAFAGYAVDVREDADHIYVDAELPGFNKDELDITLENSVLTITAEHKAESKQEKTGNYLLNERRYSRFSRSFNLPPTVDEQSVQANLTDGVLHININKREETKPRKIKVG